MSGKNIAGAYKGGTLFLGKGTTINDNGYFSAVAGGEIHLGSDNMLSYFIKISNFAHGKHPVCLEKSA